MSDIIQVTGLLLSAMPVGDFDRRIVLLTRERGKIACFVKGARRQNSPLMGTTRAFVFGTFQLYEGRTSYNVKSADIRQYFEDVMSDLDAVCYACYFAELADYYGREGMDASQQVNLLYAALRALGAGKMPRGLIRCVYELKLIALNGEAPDFFSCSRCGRQDKLTIFAGDSCGMLCDPCAEKEPDGKATGIVIGESTLFTLQYILSAALDRLFTFTVSRQVNKELVQVMRRVRSHFIDRTMRSEQMLPAEDLQPDTAETDPQQLHGSR